MQQEMVHGQIWKIQPGLWRGEDNKDLMCFIEENNKTEFISACLQGKSSAANDFENFIMNDTDKLMKRMKLCYHQKEEAYEYINSLENREDNQRIFKQNNRENGEKTMEIQKWGLIIFKIIIEIYT